MNKKMSKRQKDIKSKLMAAICMLLVSSIMMVSTTYAWFTLSTAPEVTGITTAVGANGNLEMALLPTDTTLAELNDLNNKIVSDTGDSKDAAGQLLKEANITWGNLVDLSDHNSYGLDRITLYPAALNIEGSDLNTNTGITAGSIIGTSPLGRPVYGSDGRVATLKADTLANTFGSGAFGLENTYGVRAIGTSSNMSPCELEHRSLLSLGNSNTNMAKSLASGALESHGATLAGLAIKKVNGGTDVTADEVVALNAIVTSLEDAMAKIELAIRYYVAANAIAPSASEADYLTIKDAILGTAEGGGYKNTLETIGTTYSSAVPTNFSTAVDALNAEKANIATAKADFPASGATTWDEISTGLNLLVNTDAVKINGVRADEAKTEAGVNQIINFMMAGNGIQLSMATGSGAMATIADFCGDYSTFIILPEGTNITMGVTANLSGQRAVMKTESTVGTAYLVAMESNKIAFVGGGDTGSKAISDFYGYIIDLAFRTNAANSKLLLQTAPQNRIYEDNTANEAVMGHGSSMTFTGAAGFPAVDMQDLMESIRVVFFETATRTVIAEARLDAQNADIDGAKVTADLFMYKEGKMQTAQYPAEGTNPDAAVAMNDSSIIALDQNQAKAISVLVYLDGHTVTNDDVAATAAASMTGTMNLQFSSSANLVPMDYTDLMQGEGTGSGAGTTMTTLTNVEVDEATEAAGISVSKASYVASGSNKLVGVVLSGNLPEYPEVTISVNGASDTATYAVVGGMAGYAISVDSEVAADAAIIVTVTAGEAPAPAPSESTPTESTPTESQDPDAP